MSRFNRVRELISVEPPYQTGLALVLCTDEDYGPEGHSSVSIPQNSSCLDCNRSGSHIHYVCIYCKRKWIKYS